MNQKNFHKLINILLICIIVSACIVRFVMLFYNRSFWQDEAMLAQSVLTRNFFELFATPLDYAQSAPVGYLVIVKIMSLIFGSGEWVLRLPSIVPSIFAMIILYYLLKNTFEVSNPLVGVAIFSTIPNKFFFFSIEFKPYLSDVFFVLLLLYCYYLYKVKRMNLVILTTIFSLIIWFSFPTVFIVSTILILEFSKALFKKGDGKLKDMILSGITVLLSFIIYYKFWLEISAQNIHSDPWAVEYWRHLNFPFFPMDASDIDLFLTMGKHMLSVLGSEYNPFISALFVALLFFGIVVCYSDNCTRDFSLVYIFSGLIMLFTSYIGKYPIQSRLLLYLYPFSILFICKGIDKIYKLNRKSTKIIAILIVLAFLVNNKDFVKYVHADEVYRSGSEVNKTADFLWSNIKEDEKIYVYAQSIPVFNYKNNYNTFVNMYPYVPIEQGNIILGGRYKNLKCLPYEYHSSIKRDALLLNVESITKNDKVYLFFSHIWGAGDAGVASLIQELEKSGKATLVFEERSNCLYYYEKDFQ